MTNRFMLLAALVGAAVAVVFGAIVVSSRGGSGSGARAKGSDDPAALVRGIAQHGLELGDPRAPVLLVEFADPQCPFCREFAERTWPAIVRRYVRTGKVKMQLRLLSFLGPDSLAAAKALEAASLQDHLWDASARFYARQGEENSGYVTDAFLRGVLSGIPGLDAVRAMAQRGDVRVGQDLGASHTLQTRYAVTSTPTILIGPDVLDLRKVAEQTPSPEQLGAEIDDLLRKHP